MPRSPERGSWTISTSASCSLTPSSARAESRASSTVGALLSTSRIAGPLGRTLGRTRRGPLPRLGGRPALQPANPRGAVAAGGLGLGGSLLRRLGRGQLALARTANEMLEPDLYEVRRGPVQDKAQGEREPEE